MPTYEYECLDQGHRFEVVQSFRDDALTTCQVCDGKVRKVFSAAGIVFKGSGFYVTDSRSGSRSGSSNGNGSSKDTASVSAGSGDGASGSAD